MAKTKVITYGTYDLLHYGHIELFRRAKELGDYLVVAVSTDEFNAEKGKRAYFNYEKRKSLVEAIKYVDEVIPEETWDQKRTDVQEHGIDVFVMGADWEGKFDELKPLCRVVYLARTPHISSTALREIHPTIPHEN
jgi:glycerol-3-phosphate cytidylyltransferase